MAKKLPKKIAKILSETKAELSGLYPGRLKEIILFGSRFHRYILNAFDLRNAGDYGMIHAVSAENASQTIAEAGEMLAEIKRYLASR